MYRALTSFTTKDYDIKYKQILEDDFTTEDEITEFLNVGYIEVYDGSLEITENGIYDVKDYQTADVNVGGGIDFAYAKIDPTMPYTTTNNIKDLITEIDMNGIKLEEMGNFFYSLKKLTTILNLDTSEATGLSSTFNTCQSLVTIPEIDTSKVTNFTYCFGGCTNLQNVPVLNMSKITIFTNIQGVFNQCPALTNQSLNNIMESLATINNLSYNKNLKWVGLSETQATTCTTLSNWQALANKGWTTGY